MQGDNTISSNSSLQVLARTVNSTEKYWNSSHLVYGPVMFLILTIGFVGNLSTIIVFLQKEQRTKVIAPSVMNLAVADLFIVVFGYPVSITANLTGRKFVVGEAICTWSAFVNGSTGIASIVMLTEISVLMCYTITSIRPTINTNELLSKKFKTVFLAGPWIYGILTMSPPLLGWSRFVPGSARISCAPDWASHNIQALSYNIGLVIMGFFLPMTIILISYYKLYRSLGVSSILSRHEILIRRRRRSQFKVARMMGVAIVAFVISWSPYCIISLAAISNKSYVLRNGEAEIPELMAKASVIYNPLVYALMNAKVRKTLKRLVGCRPACFGTMEDTLATPEVDPQQKWRFKKIKWRLENTTNAKEGKKTIKSE